MSSSKSTLYLSAPTYGMESNSKPAYALPITESDIAGLEACLTAQNVPAPYVAVVASTANPLTLSRVTKASIFSTIYMEYPNGEVRKVR